MANKAPIYSEENQIGATQLLGQLKEAVIELEAKMQAAAPITKAGCRVGWGVNKVHRGIAADSVISIARAIKGLKGW